MSQSASAAGICVVLNPEIKFRSQLPCTSRDSEHVQENSVYLFSSAQLSSVQFSSVQFSSVQFSSVQFSLLVHICGYNCKEPSSSGPFAGTLELLTVRKSNFANVESRGLHCSN